MVFNPALLVVDGPRVVVGSYLGTVEAAITAADTLGVPVALSQTATGTNAEIRAGAGRARVLRVVYDPEQATNVGAGENGAEKLHEYRIVREVETLSKLEGGTRRFTAKPPGPGRGQAILLQTADLRLTGAADLPPS